MSVFLCACLCVHYSYLSNVSVLIPMTVYTCVCVCVRTCSVHTYLLKVPFPLARSTSSFGKVTLSL
uniref:Uncharacterized protein n=1 Tax=Anguilla anguilla TaxID=7936 RepID=A0A0E9SVY5_ANGAN